jgi:hypothetical protein
MREISLGLSVGVKSSFPEKPEFLQQPREGQKSLRSVKVSLEAAQKGMGNQLKRPQWLPSPGMQLEGIQAFRRADNSIFETILEFDETPERFVRIQQTALSPEDHRKTIEVTVPYELIERQVGTFPAVFYSAMNLAGDQDLLVGMWPKDDFLFTLYSNGLTVDELTRIGASLA